MTITNKYSPILVFISQKHEAVPFYTYLIMHSSPPYTNVCLFMSPCTASRKDLAMGIKKIVFLWRHAEE